MSSPEVVVEPDPIEESEAEPEPVWLDEESMVEPEPVAVGVEDPEPIELESVAEPEPIVLGTGSVVVAPDPDIVVSEEVLEVVPALLAKAGTAITAVTNVHNKSFFIRPP